MAQYPIPQFIEQEGRILPFMTFRQFFTLVGGAAICFVLFYLLPITLFIVASLFVMLFAGTLAFIKVNKVSIFKFSLQYLGFLSRTKNYTWKKKESLYPFKSQKKSLENLPEIKENVGLQNQKSRLSETKKMIELKNK